MFEIDDERLTLAFSNTPLILACVTFIVGVANCWGCEMCIVMWAERQSFLLDVTKKSLGRAN